MASSVRLRRAPVVFPTYEPFPPQKNPMFLEHRVYQGSSGRVYPLPVIDRIAERPKDRAWDAVHLENEFLRVLILPEIGGRIHVLEDKTNGYDLIYRQRAIKPALVGLAGPWLSGGIEFNWPQHHRPATFMPVDVAYEEHADGSKTVWLSDHDPLQRMKGMHGVCLHPGRAVLELKVRAYNRTVFPQTFLWWANVATQVHEGYQSFFPPDVHYVADHAKRAMSAYPRCHSRYYGVDYGARPATGVPANEQPTQFVPPAAGRERKPAGTASRPDDSSIAPYPSNDLSWYANIPVPTSYMAMGSRDDFFGGYDHFRRAGIVHVADHRISPGKKQWTWGNHAFGYAWDRNLTTPDENGVYWPYIELMAGVYTDNQPDFSFLQPGETKTWSQFWYPIREIGPAHQANVEAAIRLVISGGQARIGVAVTRPQPLAKVVVETDGRVLRRWMIGLAPDRPFVRTIRLPLGIKPEDVRVTVFGAGPQSQQGSTKRSVLVAYQPRRHHGTEVPPPATEPAAPTEMASTDRLYLTGLHLAQYRHATRKPEDYWREALRRDPGDARCNQALGAWHLQRGEFEAAERHLRAAVARSTERNPNPADGEALYLLGLVLRCRAEAMGHDRVPGGPARRAAGPPADAELIGQAYDAFGKAAWNQAWQSAANRAMAEIDAVRQDWSAALDHLDRALRVNADDLRARDLEVMVLRRLGRTREARELITATLSLDPLDWWARILAADENRQVSDPGPNTQTRLDVAHDLARAGFWMKALAVLEAARPEPLSGTAPLVGYTAAWLCVRIGDERRARRWLRRAAVAKPDYCFPARLEELTILRWAAAANPHDARAPFYLGNLLYDRRRYAEAIAAWERAMKIASHRNQSAKSRRWTSVLWRNLGLAYFNVRQDPAGAVRAYDRARQADPADGRLLYERDQLWKRVGVPPVRRRRELERNLALTRSRDDLSVELASLYNVTDQPDRAAALLASRRFQPWEGGEGQVLAQHTRAHLALGRAELRRGRPEEARREFVSALSAPENLGEARHPLANAAEIEFWLGEACARLDDTALAWQHWQAAASFAGDFQEMAVCPYSEQTYFSALAWFRLGEVRRGRTLLRDLQRHARAVAKGEPKVDYFATSLPTMLLFHDDLTTRQVTAAMFLDAQAKLGLGDKPNAKRLLRAVLAREPAHQLAAELLKITA